MHDICHSQNQLHRNYRLIRTADYRSVFSRHQKVSNRYFRMLVHYRKGQSTARLGVIVSKRVSRKAVERNRIKRQIREIFRVERIRLKKADLVIIANPACASATNEELRNSLHPLFDRLSQ